MRRLLPVVGLLLILACAGAARPAAGSAARPAASPVSAPTCPDPGDEPGVGPPPGFTDSNVAVFAGRNISVRGESAEAEGLVVALGSIDVDKSNGGTFNVGTVGVGSQLSPPAGTDMLVAGGDLTIGASTRLDVGHGATDPGGVVRGGNVAVSGSISGGRRIETNGGAVINPSTAVDRYRPFAATITSVSQTLAARPVTGAVTASGQFLDLAGDGTTAEQFFTVTSAQLAAAREFRFTGIPTLPSGAYAPTVVTVTGAPTITLAPTFYSIDGTRVDDLASPQFGNAASALLWNLPTATDVTIGGTSQVLGSVLVPTPTARVAVSASTNGRLYVGGDLAVRGTGNELHNYPWRGDDAFDCQVEPPAPTGSVAITKLLHPTTVLAPAFTGTLTCIDTPRRNVVHRDWSVRAGRTTTLTELPVGYRCELAEQVVGAGGYDWATPTWTIDGRPGRTFRVGSGTLVEAGVTNRALGRFAMRKHVRDPDNGFAAADHEFALTWTCDAAGYLLGTDLLGHPTDVRAGSVRVAAGHSAAPLTPTGDTLLFPIGTRCTVRELRPGDNLLRDGFHWRDPVVDPSAITVDGRSDAVTSISVTNVVVPDDRTTLPTSPTPTSTPGGPTGTSQPGGPSSVAPGSSSDAGGAGAGSGGLALTGADVAALLGGGLALVVLGGAALLSARRRGRRT